MSLARFHFSTLQMGEDGVEPPEPEGNRFTVCAATSTEYSPRTGNSPVSNRFIVLCFPLSNLITASGFTELFRIFAFLEIREERRISFLHSLKLQDLCTTFKTLERYQKMEMALRDLHAVSWSSIVTNVIILISFSTRITAWVALIEVMEVPGLEPGTFRL